MKISIFHEWEDDHWFGNISRAKLQTHTLQRQVNTENVQTRRDKGKRSSEIVQSFKKVVQFFIPSRLMTLGWLKSFMQAASFKTSSISL